MAQNRLSTYRAKRDFRKTAEPMGEAPPSADGHRYLIQKHDATRMHFDFRLEHDGVLLSWAVPNGPSFDPRDKRLAVHVEDHPLDYGDFEGTIPKGEYGGGTVMLWDEGRWEPVGDPEEGLAKGDFKFVLHGERLKGKWVLVRMKRKPGERSKHENWLLIKEKDQYATEETKPITERALTSVRSGRTMDEIAHGNVEWKDSGFAIKRNRSDSKPAKTDAEPPKFVAPQLASLVDAPPEGDAWIHEIKYDGYRAVAAIGGGRAAVYTRRGLDWTDRFGPLVRPLLDLPCRSALLDGEVAVTDKEGRTDFGALQDAMGEGKGRGIGYYLFDLLSLDGEDLRRKPLIERKARLAELLEDQPRTGPLFYSDHVVGHGGDMLKHVCEMGLEGIISKRADAPYRSERSKGWLKSKCEWGQEFVIIGWRPSDVKGRPFSSLLLAVREGEELSYRGRVGSGFGERELSELWAELKKREVKTPPANDVPADVRRKARFVKPDLVAEIAFRGFTDEGVVRQGSYKGLRKDKKPMEIVEEWPKDVGAVAKADAKTKKAEATPGAVVTIDSANDDGAITIEGVKVTHPDKVIFPGQGITKRTLADYFLAVADHILPHVEDRPISLVRCPDGAGGDCFFQKHASPGFPKAFKPIRIKEKRRQRHLPLYRGRPGADRLRADGGAGTAPVGLARGDAGGAGPHRLRLRSGRRDGLCCRAGCGARHARPALGARPDKLSDGDRRQGHPRRRAADAALRLGGGEGVRRGAGAHDGGGRAEEIPGGRHQGEAHRPHLHRLSPQRAGRDGDRAVLAAGAQGRAGRLAGVVAGAVTVEGRAAGDGRDRGGAPQAAEERPLGRLFRRRPGAAAGQADGRLRLAPWRPI